MKKLKHFINWTIWSLLTLYVVLVVAIHLPVVQSRLGAAVAGAVGEQLGTEVSVGRIDLGMFNRLIIDDVIVKDQQREEMLRARRLSVKLELLPLTAGRISISSAQLMGVQARLYRDSLAAPANFQFVIDALSKPDDDSPSKLDLRVGSLIVSRLSVVYDQRDAPETPGRLNLRHLHVSEASAHILLRTLTNDSLSLNVKRISLREKAGLDLQDLHFVAEAGRSGATVSDFALKLPNSAIKIDSTVATYQPDSLAATLRYSTHIVSHATDLNDLACVLPDGIPAGHPLTIDARLHGTAHSIDCSEVTFGTTDQQLVLVANGEADFSGEMPLWRAQIDRLHVDGQLVAELQEQLPAVPKLASRIGHIDLTGLGAQDADGHIISNGFATTSTGNLSWQGTGHAKSRQWDVHVEADSLDLHRLTDNSAAGLLTARLDVSASPAQLTVRGDIPRIDLLGYSYSGATLDALYSKNAVTGKLKIDDPNLQADVEGSYTPHVRLTGYIAKVAPQALHLSDRWGAATFSAIVDADFSATSLADAEGTIDLDDFVMANNDTTHYHLDNLHIRSGYDDARHFLRISSDFGEANLSGHFNLSTLSQSIAALTPLTEKTNRKKPASHNDFTLAVRLSDSHWMQQLLGLPLELEGPLNLDAEVSDSTHTLDVNADIPAFTFSGNDFRNATLTMMTVGDSTLCNLQATRLTDNGGTQHVKLSAQASEQELSSQLSVSTSDYNQGSINTVARFYTNEQGQKETHVRVLPSQFFIKNATWEMEPCDIVYSDKRLMVDQFTLHHGDEHIIIDGIASTRPTDTLLVDLNGVDVAYVLDLVNFHSVEFDGRATGRAYVNEAFEKPQAWADLTVNNFLFQEAPMGTLEAHAEWNGEEGQIDLDAAIDDGAESQTFVDGFISPVRSELDLGIRARGTSIGFVHSFTDSFLSHVSGHAYGDVRVFGPLSNIDLAGEATITGRTTITALGTTYQLGQPDADADAALGDTIRLSPGTISFSNFHAYDNGGHTAVINGDIHHSNLKNISFGLHARTDGVLAYDFPRPETGSVVGGTVWADGTATLSGHPGEVVIDCNLTPTPGSIFYYNAANPDAISQQKFITWGSASLSASAASLADGHTGNGEADALQQPVPAAPQSSDIRVNLRINATPDATLYLLMDQHSDDHIILHGNGTFRASFYNKGAFQLFGTYDVERGNYSMTIQNILNKNFTFLPGSSIVFGGDPLQAALNLKASHTVNGVSLSDLGLGNSFSNNTIRVNCLMNILGTAGEPRVDFDLEMPTVNSEEQQMIRSIITTEQEMNQQVVYLLGIGRFYTQEANNAASQTYGQTELAMQSLLSGTVSSQINGLLSQVVKNDDWNFGANITTGNEGWHNAEYEGLVSGRMLNNRLLLNGQFGYRDNATQATPSFIGDFDIRYLLTPSGNIALKAYNQTNDRYFTHSSLNTQGIGIILKKDFSGFGDLFSSFGTPFAERKKKTTKSNKVKSD